MKMTRIPHVLAASILAVGTLSAHASLAQTKTEDGAQLLSTLNTDGDDTFEMPEIMKLAANVFNEINPDGDATLEPDETEGRLAAADFPKQSFPNNQEAEGDKTVDMYQWLNIARERFEAADANKGGKIEASELDSDAGKKLAAMISIDDKMAD